MKVYSLHGINDLRYEEAKYPDCPEGWAIVKVKAAGICSSDIPRIFKKGTYYFPTIPGHEFAGLVDRVSNEEAVYLIGKKVGVFPLIPCRKCPQCLQTRYEMCTNYDYIGSRRNGGFSEYVPVPIWNMIELSDSVSFTKAAMMEPLAVALHAVKQIGELRGKSLAIVGTGMIAFAAAQWARRLEASSVTVIGRTEEKRKIVEKMNGINYEVFTNSYIEYDAVLEAVGSNESIEIALNVVHPAGKVVLMGNPERNITLHQNTYWRILRKQLNVVGTWNSSFSHNGQSDWSDVRKALETHEIESEILITHTFPQERLMDGLNLMKKHEESYCKVMTLWNDV